MNHLRSAVKYVGSAPVLTQNNKINEVEVPILQPVIPRTYRSIITEKIKHFTNWVISIVPNNLKTIIKDRARITFHPTKDEVKESVPEEDSKKLKSYYSFRKSKAALNIFLKTYRIEGKSGRDI